MTYNGACYLIFYGLRLKVKKNGADSATTLFHPMESLKKFSSEWNDGGGKFKGWSLHFQNKEATSDKKKLGQFKATVLFWK